MKRKIFVLLLSILLIIGLVPLNTLAADGPFFTLEAPKNLTAELKYDEVGIPYFELKLEVPQSVKNINDIINEDPEYYEGVACSPVEVRFEYKYANYDWNQGPSEYWNTDMDLNEYLGHGYFQYRPFDKGAGANIDITAETYQFRAYFNVMWGYIDGWIDKDVKSAYSNIVTIGNPAYSYSERLFGANRIDTAVAVSKKGWPNGASVVILTRDDNYPDALTGAPLSKKLDAPILFTNSKILTAATETEIKRLKAEKVIILGGTGAVSEAIENKLAQSYQVQRIGGTDRFETAKNIAKELGYKGQAVITTGMDFHDALIVSPLAAYNSIPILLTTAASLPQATKDALAFIEPTEITVVGNTSWVSEAVFAELTKAKRISGSDIYESSVLVARAFKADAAKIFLATGKDFPDALSGSGLAAKYNSPILFVADPLSSHVKQYLSENKDKEPEINLLGGEKMKYN